MSRYPNSLIKAKKEGKVEKKTILLTMGLSSLERVLEKRTIQRKERAAKMSRQEYNKNRRRKGENLRKRLHLKIY